MKRGWLAAGGCVALIATGAAWAVPSSDPLAGERQRLTAAKQAAEAAQARADRLDAQAGAEQDAAAKAQVEERAVAARIDKAGADVAAAQSRVALVQAELDAQRGVLARRQGPIVRLIAALAGLARRPAIASVAQPGSIDDMVHVRAVLGAVAPVIARRTAGVRDELARTRALRANAALAAQSLADSRAALDRQQLRLARLEMTHRRRSAALNRASLAASDEALAMGEAAQDAIDRMETIGDQRATAAALGDLPDPAPRPASGSALASTIDGDAPYRLPVGGRLLIGFGEVSSAGVRSRGLTFAAGADATVVAPAAGRVAYARRFGDYGMVVIIDHGDGWTSLLTGLGETTVSRGATVAKGTVIGRAGRDGDVTVELRRRGRPVDMVPLLA
ncbi:murein hydrolase activator EnvC family protein [Hephaestia mangrovi]|uniref:murein hydrolase activator EnvC family protein n=1 Tax=Hephaestia mangrovi TaxID=2873268 RepID=UPI001CA68841|nr:peptidoglycan DD-metalloendopeptidase family protein [Hephaestia mangrovi]MBY8828174.1 peptidoglycan DD-metalloendopeptidase family protein [Hephaestia mangrovi]